MPLSEHEQRLLEQMERALYAEDPKFASSLRGKDPRSNFRRRVLLAAVGFIVGVVLLMTGLVAQVILVSMLGFLVDAGQRVLRGHQLPRRHDRQPSSASSTAPASRKPRTATRRSRGASAASGGFMQRIEERWNRRRDERPLTSPLR